MRVLIAITLGALCAPAQQYTISTIAGGGPVNVPAISANLRLPNSIAWDAAGNYYVVCYARVFRVNTSGNIDLVVGNGTRSASSGDGGPASQAYLSNGAQGIAIDPEGNLYIGDVTRLRKVTVSTGIITTIAGTGGSGSTGDGGAAASATFNYIYGVARDPAGNLYVADNPGRRIRKIAAGTGIITTVAGGGTASPGDGGAATNARLAGPNDVEVDTAGNLYIADGARIRKVAAGTGIITTVAGGGLAYPGEGVPAPTASLFSAVSISLDASGNILFSDYNRIRKVTASTGVISTVAAVVTRAFGIASDGAGNVLYTETDHHQIRRIAVGATTPSVIAGNGTPYFSGVNVAATNAALGFPVAVAFDSSGNMFIADSDNQRVRKVAAGTGTITTVAGTGAASSTGDGGLATAATLNGPWALAVDSSNNLYIAENYGHRVRKIAAQTGVITTVAGTGQAGTTGDGGAATSAQLYQPTSIAVDSAGNLYIGSAGERVRKVAPATGIITTYAGGGTANIVNGTSATTGFLGSISALAVDSGGNLYVASDGVDAIYRVNAASQTFTVILAPFSFNGIVAGSLAVDGAGNVLFGPGFGSAEEYKIWRIPAGTASPVVIAGNGVLGNTGDGAAALAARFGAVFDVANDAAGNYYLVDGFHGRVRKLTPSAVSPPAAPVLLTPAANANNVAAGTSLTWQASTGATSYDVRLGTTNPPPFYTSTTGTTVSAGTLSFGGVYYWSVTAAGAGGSTASAVRSFQVIGGAAPGPVSNIVPAMNATGVGTAVTLSWSSSGATSYDLYFPDTSTLRATLTTPSYSLTGLAAGTRYTWRIVARNPFGSTEAVSAFTTVAANPGVGNFFVPLTPCRVMDTRAAQGTSGIFGPPSMRAGEARDIPIPVGRCPNIPDSATAYSLNVTVVPKGPLAYITLWPAGVTRPVVSTLNAFHGGILANAAIVPAGAARAISVFVTDATDLILDINGYFQAGAGDAFAPVDPCRLADTRTGSGFGGSFGAPILAAQETRSFPLATGSCGLPANATSFSLNATVVPSGALGFLTLWPSGRTQPVVSTLNSLEGNIVANAALVPAGPQGGVSAFVTNPSHLILDVNGYFRPSNVAGGLAFYPVTPCRAVDTRLAGDGAPQMNRQESRNFAIAGKCGIPSTAKAYALNVTVVPSLLGLGYLSLWPAGKAQPFVSTLNSLEGRILANAAIVPAGAGGQVSVFVTDATHVILDVNGYFQ